MAKTTTFKVSSRKHTGFEDIELKRTPETLEEFESLNLVNKYPDGVIDLALQSLVIKMQGGARSRLEQGREAVQEYVDNYTYGARTGGGVSRKPTLTTEEAKSLRFTKAQLEALKQAGVSIVDQTAEEEEETEEAEDEELVEA